MDRASFCTCTDKKCEAYPDKHGGQCTACVKKNLDCHEIPACFWKAIGRAEGQGSDYTFAKFARRDGRRGRMRKAAA